MAISRIRLTDTQAPPSGIKNMSVKASAAWKGVTGASVRVAGAWKPADAYVKQGSEWKKVHDK